MAELTLSNPVGYYGGKTQTGGPFLGFQYSDGDINYVLRYKFTTPSGGKVTSLKLKTKLSYYSGDTGYKRPIRVKVTTSATSHTNAGASADYDAEYSYSVTTESTSATITINGLSLSANTDYYLYLFPGSGFANDGSAKNGQFLLYCYDNSGADQTTLEYTAMQSGLAYIDNGSSWDAYEVYIDNGSSWDQYIPYIDDGTDWVMCN